VDTQAEKPGTTRLPRLGGELPLFADRFGARRDWEPNWLAFSHGRAALAWFLKARKPKSALICAYTCPIVPTFLRRMKIEPAFFDVGSTLAETVTLARRLPAPRLVILPALFGSPPRPDPEQLAKALGSSAIVVVDAAQTAFGHRDFSPPAGGATFSCPRKTTGLADGAVLALGRGVRTVRTILTLPIVREATAWKYAAHALWATRRQELETQALEFNRRGEQALPSEPHRMSDESRLLLERMDADWHRTVRRRNRRILAAALGGHIPIWAPDSGTPFSLPVFVRDPAAVIADLKRQRIFATALWPDSEYDPHQHPAAAYMVRHLVSLPVDQRHSQTDMTRIAAATLQTATPPTSSPPDALGRMVRL
jgi:hypothetical protein